MKLVLASASPRRRHLLADAGYELVVDPADIDESVHDDETPAAAAERLARSKAETVARRHPAEVVVGADTVVACGNDTILGKPSSREDAKRMLRQLSGTVHQVITGVAIRRLDPPLDKSWTAVSRVHFQTLSAATIEHYLDRVDTLDKAGAYAIQEHGNMLIERVDGPVSNVIGLPVEQVAERLTEEE